jgi:N-acetylneuraminic acid mutarotase
MNPPIFGRARAVIAILGLLQSLLGCGAAEDIPQGPWTRAAPMPTARSELTAAALDGRIYLAGGIAQWERRRPSRPTTPPQTAGRSCRLCPRRFTTSQLQPRTSGSTSLAATPTYCSARSRERRWARIADLPAPRAAHGMAAIEGKLYVVGGVGPGSKDLWIYDPATDRWDVARAALPRQREHLAMTVLDGKLHAIGGRWEDRGNLAAHEIYDPATGTWTQGPDLPTARSGLTAGVLDGHVHVTGGESLSRSHTFDEHEAYDPTATTWTTLASVPTPRHGLASAVVSGRWYVIGDGSRAGALTFISLSDLVEVFPGRPEGAE